MPLSRTQLAKQATINATASSPEFNIAETKPSPATLPVSFPHSWTFVNVPPSRNHQRRVKTQQRCNHLGTHREAIQILNAATFNLNVAINHKPTCSTP
ncbi:hypothetical protein DEO72_LG6g1415 [Vigna unguiculata]|uniref:Uncharacterized protein n=1 Tax=Vigna unguiculata TaxID=3917 RepID=A0A4D6M726_VIGUN|nr:hypothetical protein DEO72_LG6g1415 [Vigna unguiculata]